MAGPGRVRLFEKVEDRFGQRIADLFGTRRLPVSWGVGKVPQGAAAVTQGQRITFDRDYLEGASRADIRGAAIHELTHAYEVGHGGDPDRIETLADYARLTLNKNENPDWRPSRAVRLMAERRGDMANNAGGNGPRAGQSTGRSRDTTVNRASKATPYNPYASVGTAFSSAQELAAARYQQLLQLAQLKAQKAQLKGVFREGRAQAGADRVAGMADTANAALESGGYGSSVHFGGIADVGAAHAAELARLRQERALGKLGIQQEKLGINAEYAQQVAAIQAALAEDQFGSLLDQFSSNLYGANGVSYQDILKLINARKTGNAPRRRSGVNGGGGDGGSTAGGGRKQAR